jgi:hypothetical protein
MQHTACIVRRNVKPRRTKRRYVVLLLFSRRVGSANRYQRFRLQPWRWRSYVPPKRRYLPASLHAVRTYKNVILTAVRTSQLKATPSIESENKKPRSHHRLPLITTGSVPPRNRRHSRTHSPFHERTNRTWGLHNNKVSVSLVSTSPCLNTGNVHHSVTCVLLYRRACVCVCACARARVCVCVCVCDIVRLSNCRKSAAIELKSQKHNMSEPIPESEVFPKKNWSPVGWDVGKLSEIAKHIYIIRRTMLSARTLNTSTLGYIVNWPSSIQGCKDFIRYFTGISIEQSHLWIHSNIQVCYIKAWHIKNLKLQEVSNDIQNTVVFGIIWYAPYLRFQINASNTNIFQSAEQKGGILPETLINTLVHSEILGLTTYNSGMYVTPKGRNADAAPHVCTINTGTEFKIKIKKLFHVGLYNHKWDCISVKHNNNLGNAHLHFFHFMYTDLQISMSISVTLMKQQY